jgi:AAA domain
VLSPEPAQAPEIKEQRIVTVSAAQRDTALARKLVRPEDILPSPRRSDELAHAPPRFDLKLRLADRANVKLAIDKWIAETRSEWSIEEIPRRKTISLYQRLYKLFQLLQIGSAEGAIEVIWGVGLVRWQKDGAIIDRPLLERRVDIELDEAQGGAIRVRPTSADATFDLKPYEEFGCPNLGILSDLIRREIQRVADGEGVSPFASDSYDMILQAACARLDPSGRYVTQSAIPANEDVARDSSTLTITDNWIVFARPRSQHVVLQDINRLRRVATNETSELGGLAETLVTPPSLTPTNGGWEPLGTVIGQPSNGPNAISGETTSFADNVFFPKPFNDDQIAIVRKLSKADGFVVQGPPGTGKTHTIANLICHYMALGQRILVVSHGEAALAVRTRASRHDGLSATHLRKSCRPINTVARNAERGSSAPKPSRSTKRRDRNARSAEAKRSLSCRGRVFVITSKKS